eukprot:357001-Chlamydomonas_euryale.AAC.11
MEPGLSSGSLVSEGQARRKNRRMNPPTLPCRHSSAFPDQLRHNSRVSCEHAHAAPTLHAPRQRSNC